MESETDKELAMRVSKRIMLQYTSEIISILSTVNHEHVGTAHHSDQLNEIVVIAGLLSRHANKSFGIGE